MPPIVPVTQAVGSGAYNGMEAVLDLIEAQVKATIGDALANVRTQRADPVEGLVVPKEYFQYTEAKAYRCPAVFIIAEDMDFTESRGQNHINSLDRVMVGVVLEGRTKDLLIAQTYRYQAALMQCLHHVVLTTADGTLKVISRVRRCSFSGVEAIKNEKTPEAGFRKEVDLELAIDHYENLV